MSDRKFLPLPYGYNGYEEIRNDNCYFVDKTSYLKNVLEGSGKVLLFTRPRRFGKTVFMSTLNSFLKINKDNPSDTSEQLRLFEGTQILKDTEFCEKYMGKYPVIFITLKSVDGDNFEDAYKRFAAVVSKVASEYKYLLESSKLDAEDKDKLKKLSDISFLRLFENSDYLTGALNTLSALLYKKYGKLPVLLIDEYDVPLAKASYHDLLKYRDYTGKIDANDTYHSRMVTLMSGFLDILKNENTLTKTVMTGCLKVAKNSIFTGVNNLKVNTVTSQNLALTGIIGFTKEETLKALKDYEMDEYAELVKNSYDGYRFCDKEMFCPWDVINFIDENYKNNLSGHKELVKANNYWAATTSGHAVYEYLGYLTDTDTQKMQDLIDGKTISFSLNDSMNYDCLSQHKSDDFWSLLLHTGYLTLDWDKTTEEELNKDGQTNKNVFARIPNLEIRECFTDNIKERFSNVVSKDSLPDKLISALANGNTKDISDIFFDMLQKYVSVRDSATKAPLENFYHGFLNGIFSGCEGLISEFRSNYESGNGYADITFKTERNSKAVIIEIKATSKDEEMDELAAEALSQIEEKNYALPFTMVSKITDIYAYGIVFCRKDCIVTFKKLK